MEEKSNLGKFIKWNLIIYFGVSFLELITAKLMMGNTADGYTGVFFMILSMMSVGLQVVVNGILSIIHFIKKNNELGKSYLLSLLIILLIGFPLCFTGLLLKQ